MRELTGKVAVITGAGSGIGRATALALGASGADVAVCDLNGDAAAATTDEIRALGRRASVHRVDVAVADEMAVLPAAVLNAHGAVDILVNNAGIATAPEPLTETPAQSFEHVMNVNFWGVVHGTRAFLPHLQDRPAAHIVNVISHAGLVGFPRMSPYVASKFATRGFSESIQMELRATPVKVTTVFPGTTRTSIMANSPVISAEMRAATQRGLERSPTVVRPERVARAIVRGIQRERSRVLVGSDTAFLAALARLFPGSYGRLIGGPVSLYIDKVFAVRPQ